MSSYWQAAERALPRNCSNDWVAVTKYVDDVFTNGSDQEVHDLKVRIITAEFSGPGGNTTRLEELGYLNTIDQFNASDLAYYLMDPLGEYQVCLPPRDGCIYPNLKLAEHRTPPSFDVLRCHGDQERDRTYLL